MKQIVDQILPPLISANAADPVLFRYGGAPVWIELDDDRRPTFRSITQDRMRHVLAWRFSWHRYNRNGEQVPTNPPLEVVRDLLASPNIDLPIVEGIVSVPVFAPDGTLQLEPGYNPATRRVYLPGDRLDRLPPVSVNPGRDEVGEALALIEEILDDFPFVNYGKAHALAALLVPFVRPMIIGPTPLHLIEKPKAGTGATLLAQVICDICLGYPIAAMTEAKGEDEFSRKIHSKLLGGPAAILLDNLRQHLDSPALAAALTADLFEDRVVQRSATAAAPIRCLWLGTANNPSLSSEMARRTIPIRMDARMEQPHLRTDFAYPNLREVVAQNHELLVWAVLTLVSAWLAAGRPKGTKKLGMYESHSEIIGGILDVAGVPGFLDIAQQQAKLEDGESNLAPVIPLWQDKFQFQSVGAKELFPQCAEIDLGGGSETSRKIILGKMLHDNRDRVFGDVVIVEAGMRAGSNLWRLAPAKDGPNN
jgi:hypothetical protein